MYIQTAPTSETLSTPPQSSQPLQTRGYQNYEHNRRRTPRQYSPLPKTLSQLLPMLIAECLIAKEIPRENPPVFVGFDPSKSFDFHRGEKTHTTDNCLVLKNKVQNLIDKGLLSFKNAQPHVQQNPFLDHIGGVNAILRRHPMSQKGLRLTLMRYKIYWLNWGTTRTKESSYWRKSWVVFTWWLEQA